MNKNEENKLKRNRNVVDLFEKNPDKLATIPHGKEALERLTLNDQVIIENMALLQQSKQGGQRSDKSNKRAIMTENVFDDASKLHAYAVHNNDLVLAEACLVTKKMLTSASDLTFIAIGNSIVLLIDDHLPNLAAYKLSEESQLILRASIAAFMAVVDTPKQNLNNKKELNDEIGACFDNTDDAVDDLTEGMNVIRKTDSVFYNQFVEASKIPDYGRTSLQVKGQVNDTQGNPVAGGIVSFYQQGLSTLVLQKKTAELGGFTIKTLPEGMYDIVVEKTGLVTYKGTARVIFEELCRLSISLETKAVS